MTHPPNERVVLTFLWLIDSLGWFMNTHPPSKCIVLSVTSLWLVGS